MSRDTTEPDDAFIANWLYEWTRSDTTLTWESFLAKKKIRFQHNAKQRAFRQLRAEVWERDKGICQVCGDAVEDEYYECGHIVDRCAGGADSLDNLVVMCNVCNRKKPVHDTKEDYERWVWKKQH